MYRIVKSIQEKVDSWLPDAGGAGGWRRRWEWKPYLTMKILQQRPVKGKEETEDSFHFDPLILC